MFHEPQPASDAALPQAGEVLEQIQTQMTQHEQQRVLAHVEKAINEIRIALRIR